MPEKLSTENFQKLLRDYISFNEGRRKQAYKDSRGIWTVGVGYNLEKSGAREKIESMGIDYDALVAGKIELTDAQIDTLLDEEIEVAEAGARSIINNFDELDQTRQIVLIDMVFNLGKAGLSKFKNMIAAVERRDWPEAAAQMKDSLWYRQVGNRGVRDVEAMRTGIMPQFPR